MSSTSNDTTSTTPTTIERIGLYSDDAYYDNSTSLGTNNDNRSSNTEEQSQSLPIVLKQLFRKGYKPGDACPLNMINDVDNMNYYGAEASLDMLTEIQILLKHHGETKSSDDDDGNALTILDVGSGFGGTARVMLSALNDHKSKAYCIELQKHIHDTAKILSDMACKDPSNHLKRDHIIHIQGNVVSDTSFVMEPHDNNGSSSSTTTLDDTFFQNHKVNVIVSRLAVLHIPVKDRQPLFQRLSNWCQPGAVLIIEDFAISDDDGPLSKKTSELLRDKVYVPNGTLPTLLEYQTTLEDCGFQNVEFQNCTERWGQFVKERYQAAETNKETFDQEMGGSGRREFYHAINDIFEEALDTNNPSGFVGVKVYAIKK